MNSETVTGTLPLVAGAEVVFAILTNPHALAEILINANGQKGAENSEWRLYDVTPAGAAEIWSGVLGIPPIAGAHRLTPEGGIAAGGLYQLRCFSRTATTGPVSASLVGYDPGCCGEPTPPPDPNEAAAVLVWGKQTLLDLPTPCFLPPGYDNSSTTTADPIALRAPRDGKLSDLWIDQNAPGAGPGNLSYTVRVNGAPTILAAITPLGDASDSNVVDTIAVAEGDEIDLRVTVDGLEGESVLPTRVVASVRFGKP
jgi:hypothetical protein